MYAYHASRPALVVLRPQAAASTRARHRHHHRAAPRPLRRPPRALCPAQQGRASVIDAGGGMTAPMPPVPADLDLRDFPFMPLDVLRLRDSDLATLASGDEF